MSGESENEFGSAGSTPAPNTAERTGGTGGTGGVGDGHEPAYHPRPFRSWASAREEEPGPSVWSRMRDRVAGLFNRRRNEDVPQPLAEAAVEPAAELSPGRVEDDADVEWLDLSEPGVPEAASESETAGLWEPEAVEESEAVEEPEAVEESEAGKLQIPRSARDDHESTPSALADETPDAVAPPDDFKFPWTRSGESPAPAEAVALPDSEPGLDTPSEPDFFSSAAEPLSESAPEPKRPGFFARLFGRKKQDSAPAESAQVPAEEAVVVAELGVVEEVETETSAADVELRGMEPQVLEEEEIIRTNEYPVEPLVEATALDEHLLEDTDLDEHLLEDKDLESLVSSEDEQSKTFASVEEALPATEDQLVEEAEEGHLAEEPFVAPEPEPKRGFFSRFFGRREKPAPRPSLEIEIHEDRIAAAADALDDVGEQTFAEAQEEPVASADEFESVDEALPAGDQKFAPPESHDDIDVVREFHDIPEVVEESRATIEVVQESRNTVEIVPESRNTMEVAQESRDIMEVHDDFGDTLEVVEAVPPASTAFGDTLELEEKTDEFEIVTAPVDVEGPPEDMGGDTAQVSRKTLIERLLFWRKKEAAKIVEGGGTVVEGNPVFLFSKFRAFYNEIIRFKHQKSEFTAGFATAIVTDYTADLSPDAAAEGLSKKLTEMLELQAAEAKWMGGEAGERYPDAQYAMAALADETFTHMEWEGQAAWPKFLLEVKLYKTHAADVELFRRIDKLLKEQPNSAVARDMARVYLLVIAAGFRGKYRPFGLTRALAEYRQRLYEYIHQGDALMLYAAERKIFPDATSRTLEGHAVSRFTAAQRWAAILIFLVVGYTVLAHFAWNRVSADLKDVTERIKSGNTTTGAR